MAKDKKEREKLIELIKIIENHTERTCLREDAEFYGCEGCEFALENDCCDLYARKADYLIRNRVIVLPLEIGEKVYCLAQPCSGCRSYNGLNIEQCRKCQKWEIIQCNFDYDLIPEFNKKVFPTKEEAEQALVNYKSSKNDKYGKKG